MRELSQRNGCRVLNVGGSEVGGSFMEPQDHSASELWLYVLLGETGEIFVHYFTTFFQGDHFSAQMGRLSSQKASSPFSKVSIDLRHGQRNNINVKTHFSLSLVCHSSHPTASTTVFLYFLQLFLPLKFFQTRA